MKILEVNKFNYAKGGADRHFLDLVQLLKSKGHEVAVFSMNHPKNNLSPWKKYFVSYVGYNKNDSTFWERIKGVCRMFYSFEARLKMRRLLADFKPDLVHIHNIYHQISPSILAEIKKKNIPIVMTVHDYKLICPNYLLECKDLDWEKAGKKKYWQFIWKKCFKNSYIASLLVVVETLLHSYLKIYEKNIDYYFVPSRFLKNKLVKNGMTEGKIVVLPHFFLESQAQNQSVGNPEKYIFYLGRISKDKGVNELISIFQKIENRDVKLYLAGEIESGFSLERNAQIKYLGVLSRAEVDKYIAGALFVVSGSKLPETFGLIAMEAISSGKPFLGYDFGAYGEIIDNGLNGFLCHSETDFYEKAKLLIDDDNLRKCFSQSALKKAELFKDDLYAKKIITIFKKTVINKIA